MRTADGCFCLGRDRNGNLCRGEADNKHGPICGYKTDHQCDVSYQYDIEGYWDTIITSYDVSTDKYWYGLDENSDTIILQKESWINAGVMEEYAVYQGNESYGITYQYKPFVVYGNGFTSLLDSHGNGNAVNYDAGSLLFSLNEFGFSNPQYTCDADGYLIKVIDGDTTYELYYE